MNVALNSIDHSRRVRRVSARPVRRTSSSFLPLATIRSAKMAQTETQNAHITAEIPTAPSSERSFGTETMRMLQTKRMNASTPAKILIALDGAEKKRDD